MKIESMRMRCTTFFYWLPTQALLSPNLASNRNSEMGPVLIALTSTCVGLRMKFVSPATTALGTCKTADSPPRSQSSPIAIVASRPADAASRRGEVQRPNASLVTRE